MRTLRSLAKPAVPLVALGAALWLATPAFAHINPDPPAVEAGKATTVGFNVEHGCAESPTTSLDIQLPAGTNDASGVDGDGFTASVEANVVTFTGGPLDAETAKTFQVRFTPPATPGDVPVKIVQTCEQGQLDWIEVAEAGEPEPEHPAPVLKVTEGVPTPAEERTDHDHDAAGSSSDDHDPEDHDAAAGAARGHEADDAEHGGDAAGADHDAGREAATDDDSGSNAPLFIGIGAAVVVVGVGAALYLRSRRGDAPAG